MSTAEAQQENTEFVDFWNEILVPKFTKYRHILVGGLTHHSEKIFPTLEVKEGDKVRAYFLPPRRGEMHFTTRIGAGPAVTTSSCTRRLL